VSAALLGVGLLLSSRMEVRVYGWLRGMLVPSWAWLTLSRLAI
jgi:hypothetical protein